MRRKSDPLSTPAVEVPKFSTGEAANILGTPIWRLQRFLDSPSYRLSPAGQLGVGRGSRRLFSIEDLYRIGIAGFLTRDGFAPKFVSTALKFIEEGDLTRVDDKGDFVRFGILFRREKGELRMEFFPSGQPPEIKVGGPVYYALDLGEVTRHVDDQISAVMNKKGRR